MPVQLPAPTQDEEEYEQASESSEEEDESEDDEDESFDEEDDDDSFDESEEDEAEGQDWEELEREAKAADRMRDTWEAEEDKKGGAPASKKQKTKRR